MSMFQSAEYDKIQDEQIKSKPAYTAIAVLAIGLIAYIVICLTY